MLTMNLEVKCSVNCTLFPLTFVHHSPNQVGNAFGHASRSFESLHIHPEDLGKIEITEIPKAGGIFCEVMARIMLLNFLQEIINSG